MPPQTENRSNSFLIPLAIVVAGAMIAGAVFFSGSAGPRDVANAIDNTVEVDPVGGDDHVLGNPEAPIIVVEYSDLECPFCKVFHNTMHQVVDEYQGQVAWVYRHFPIEQLHAKAIKEAEASECAAEQGGSTIFWKYIDRVFALTNSNDSLDQALLPQIAQELGLNVAAFNNCLSSGKYTQKISDDIDRAVAAGARGTPYSLIMNDGEIVGTINGAEPIEGIRLKIDAALD